MRERERERKRERGRQALLKASIYNLVQATKFSHKVYGYMIGPWKKFHGIKHAFHGPSRLLLLQK